MTAKLGAAGARNLFDPLTIAWESLYWPGGDNFQAEGYTDGQVLNSGETIPDESPNGNDATTSQTDLTLTYAASSNVNGKPAVRGASIASGDHPSYANTLPTGLTSYSVVVVWYQNTILQSFSQIVHDVFDSAVFSLIIAQDGRLGIGANSASNYTAAGTIVSGNTYGFRINFTPTQATAHLDDSEIFDSVATMATLNGVKMFIRNLTSWPFSGDLAFLGVFDGDVAAETEWPSFAQWVSSQFGATI